MNLQLKNRIGVKYLREIYIDERLWGVLPVKLLSLYLYLDSVDEKQSDDIQELLYRYARDRVFKFLAKQEHSEFESTQFLKRLNFHPDIITKVIDFCLDKNFISDARLTELYVRSMIDLGKSKIDIRYKMRQKGISSDLLQSELEKQYSFDIQNQVLEENVEKVMRRFATQPKEKFYDKCCAFLIRKGFKYSEFSDILKRKLKQDSN